MTRRGHTTLPEDERTLIAWLMHLHLVTHPERLGRMYGISGHHVRNCWRERIEQSPQSLEQLLLRCLSQLKSGTYTAKPDSRTSTPSAA